MALAKWNGDLTQLPAEHEHFIFSGDGQEYFWKTCDCSNISCQRPTAYRANGEHDVAMQFRLRGLDQGVDAADLAAKFFGVSETADRIADGASPSDILMEIFVLVESGGVINTHLLETKGISEEEYITALYGDDDDEDDLLSLLGDFPAPGNNPYLS